MNEPALKINRASAVLLDNFKVPKQGFDNLFVITHLGQLKQMEALICSRKIENNCLLVLYTVKNLVVPQSVHNQYSDLFEKVVFLEIPFGVNKANFNKLLKLLIKYKKCIDAIRPKNLYLNSFEGHYAMLASIAKQRYIQVILVEEGTATYKFNMNQVLESKPENYSIDVLLKDKFMSTVGQSQLFKKLVKIHKYNKELYKQSKKFIYDISNDESIQGQLIELVGNKHLKASLKPFKKFDKAYASFPELIKQGFGIKDVDYFLIHEVSNHESLKSAQDVIAKYNITENDILYVSQRYSLNPEQYVKAVSAILTRLMSDNQKVFIKLHPKESTKVYDAFKYLEFASNGKFILIEDSQFLIESVIKVSGIRQLIGLTSTTLVYGPLVSPKTQSISIADMLIYILEKKPENKKGIEVIREHLKILKVFDNIDFK